MKKEKNAALSQAKKNLRLMSAAGRVLNGTRHAVVKNTLYNYEVVCPGIFKSLNLPSPSQKERHEAFVQQICARVADGAAAKSFEDNQKLLEGAGLTSKDLTSGLVWLTDEEAISCKMVQLQSDGTWKTTREAVPFLLHYSKELIEKEVATLTAIYEKAKEVASMAGVTDAQIQRCKDAEAALNAYLEKVKDSKEDGMDLQPYKVQSVTDFENKETILSVWSGYYKKDKDGNILFDEEGRPVKEMRAQKLRTKDIIGSHSVTVRLYNKINWTSSEAEASFAGYLEAEGLLARFNDYFLKYEIKSGASVKDILK